MGAYAAWTDGLDELEVCTTRAPSLGLGGTKGWRVGASATGRAHRRASMPLPSVLSDSTPRPRADPKLYAYCAIVSYRLPIGPIVRA